ncbi:hypothetical protein Tco_0869211 [Tanacetum coccineum]
MSAKSKIINNVRYITAKVAGKPVTISEASIRSDLLFDDANGIDSMHNQAIFDAIQLIGHLDAKKKFVMYPRFILVFLDKQLKNVPVPLEHFPINDLTSEVFSFMVKKGKHFSRNVTPLFESMLVNQLRMRVKLQKDNLNLHPNPLILTQVQTNMRHSLTHLPDLHLLFLFLIPFQRALVGIIEVTYQAKEIKHLKAHIKKLKNKAKPVITNHKAWMKSVSMKQILAGKKPLKKKWMQKESVSKQGRKPAKFKPIVHKDPDFDDLDDIVDDAMDYMETEDAQDEGRTSFAVLEEKESVEKGVSTEDQVSTVKPDEGTAKPKDGTSDESPTPTTVFRDDETIAEFLVSMSQTKAKQKGVEIKDAEDSDRPRATSTRSVLTLKPLPKIDPKDKGKKVLKEEAESDAELEGVDEAERKFDQLAKNEEIARKRKRETFIVEKRAKFLYDTIVDQRRFLAQQRAAAIRSRPLTRTQLRNQMMTYLKHVGGKKHADLKNKNFEEIQVLYKKIKELNEESKDPKKKRVVNETPREEDTAKVPVEQEVTEQGTKKRKSGHVKMIARKRPRPQPDDDSDDEHRKCLRIQYSKIIPQGIELILWRHLKIMMESSTEKNDQGDFWNNQQDWEIFRWRLYEACGVCILELKDGTVIYMLVERRYPLSKELLQRMLDLGLEVEEESTAALHLVRFIKQQLNEE